MKTTDQPVVQRKSICPSSLNDQSNWVILGLVGAIIASMVISLPIIYVSGRDSIDNGIVLDSVNVSSEYSINECTQPSESVKGLLSLTDEEPFPYRHYNLTYRPSVITKSILLLFGFRHDQRSWSIDNITFVDKTTNIDLIKNGDFESNFLKEKYSICILSNSQSWEGDILFDLPFGGDFYYNDQTKIGMAYLIQLINVTGGRYYNISFYVENRGYPKNNFVVLVGALP